MNEQAIKFLEQLALKLDTTINHLWGVLLQQAMINALIDLLYCGFTIIFGIILYKLHKRFLKEDENKHSLYCIHCEALVIPMVLLAIFFLIMIVVCLFLIIDMISGFFNPEYWALKQLLNTCN